MECGSKCICVRMQTCRSLTLCSCTRHVHKLRVNRLTNQSTAVWRAINQAHSTIFFQSVGNSAQVWMTSNSCLCLPWFDDLQTSTSEPWTQASKDVKGFPLPVWPQPRLPVTKLQYLALGKDPGPDQETRWNTSRDWTSMFTAMAVSKSCSPAVGASTQRIGPLINSKKGSWFINLSRNIRSLYVSRTSHCFWLVSYYPCKRKPTSLQGLSWRCPARRWEPSLHPDISRPQGGNGMVPILLGQTRTKSVKTMELILLTMEQTSEKARTW